MTDYQDQYTLDPAFRRWVDVKVETKHGQTAVEAAALRAENKRQIDMIDAQRVRIQQLEQQLEKKGKGKK